MRQLYEYLVNCNLYINIEVSELSVKPQYLLFMNTCHKKIYKVCFTESRDYEEKVRPRFCGNPAIKDMLTKQMFTVGYVAVCIHNNQSQAEYEWVGNIVKRRKVSVLIALRRLRRLHFEDKNTSSARTTVIF